MVSYVADTSVLTRLGQSAVFARLAQIGTYRIRVPAVCVLEMGFTARNEAEHRRIVDMLNSGFTVLTASPWAQEHAIEMQRLLAVSGQHRSARLGDLLVAASALQADATVLHYDRDFDTVARVTGQPCEWVAPAGSLDAASGQGEG